MQKSGVFVLADARTHRTQEVMAAAMELADRLKPKGQGPAKSAMHGIKCGVYKDVLEVRSF